MVIGTINLPHLPLLYTAKYFLGMGSMGLFAAFSSCIYACKLPEKVFTVFLNMRVMAKGN